MIIDTVQDAAQTRTAGTQKAVEPEALFGGLNLTRVSRADGCDGIAVDETAFQEINSAVEFEQIRAEEPRNVGSVGK